MNTYVNVLMEDRFQKSWFTGGITYNDAFLPKHSDFSGSFIFLVPRVNQIYSVTDICITAMIFASFSSQSYSKTLKL